MSHQGHNLIYTVTRQDPVLIPPAKPTPNGLKDLSDLDENYYNSLHFTFVHFYRKCNDAKERDPIKVIKEAIAQALVYFYPLAGRLKKTEGNKKTSVDCTGEGVMFVAASADVSIDAFGDDLIHPPFPSIENLIFDMHQPLFGSPLLHFQVTKLKCGGFVVATQFNHIMLDGYGISMFLLAVSEMTSGLSSPTTQPVWNRHLLSTRNPSQVTFEHHELNMDPTNKPEAPILTKWDDRKVMNIFLFDSETISSIRKLVALDITDHCTTFDLIASTMWRAWTMSTKFDPTTKVSMSMVVNVRPRFNPPFNPGYYGNLFTFSNAFSTVGQLKAASVGHAAQLIQQAKNQVTEEYMRSTLDSVSLRNDMQLISDPTCFTVTDHRRLGIGLQNIDYGWGKPVYAGLPFLYIGASLPGILTCFQIVKDNKGEEIGTIMPISLSEPAMDSLINELNIMMGCVGKSRTWKKTTNTLVRWTE